MRILSFHFNLWIGNYDLSPLFDILVQPASVWYGEADTAMWVGSFTQWLSFTNQVLTLAINWDGVEKVLTVILPRNPVTGTFATFGVKKWLAAFGLNMISTSWCIIVLSRTRRRIHGVEGSSVIN